MADLADAAGPEARQHAALAFWDTVVDAADSIVFRLLFNSLRAAYEPTITALAPVMEAEVENVAGYRALAAAVVAGDSDGAHAAADALLRPGTEGIGQPALPARRKGQTMTKASPEIEAKARERLAADESRITDSSRRTSQTLRQAAKAFWSHPSPWLLGGFLVGSIGYRATLHSFTWPELIAPVVLVVFFPVIEWVIHVGILHWRPRRVAGVPVDSLLARKHREHHADPRVLPLVFVPWQAELWLLPSYVVVALVAFPGSTPGATFLVAVGALMFNYEWVHYLVHSDYRPRSGAFRGVWRNHRLHHYKNEHYWFTVTSSGTADRLFGTYPEVSTVRRSKTVRDLHALEERRGPSLEESRQESAEPAR